MQELEADPALGPRVGGGGSRGVVIASAPLRHARRAWLA